MKLKLKLQILLLNLFTGLASAEVGDGIRTPSDSGFNGFIGLLFGFPNMIAGGLLGYFLMLIVFVPSFAAGAYAGDVMKGYLGAGFLTLGASFFLMAFQILPSQGLIVAALAYLLGLALIDK